MYFFQFTAQKSTSFRNKKMVSFRTKWIFIWIILSVQWVMTRVTILLDIGPSINCAKFCVSNPKYDLEVEKEFLDSQEVDFNEVKASKYKRKEKIPFREKFLAEPYRGLICGILTEISGRSGGGKTAFCIEV